MNMKSTSKTEHQLVSENEELRARLDEAEETLRAIRSGEVDALIVSGVGGDQVFTLKGADHSYRTLIEGMSEGALTLTAEGVILYANRRFAEMLKTPLEKVIGATIHTWIAPDSQWILQSLLSKDVDEKRRENLVLTVSDGTQVPVRLSVSKLLNNEIPYSFGLVVTDLSEQERSEAIVTSERLTRELLAASNQSRRVLLSVIEDQKQAETAVKHANRALSTLSAVNRILVHATSEEEMLQEICQSIVQRRGYRLAWVGYVQHDADKSIKIMAHADHDEGYVDTMQLTWAEEERGMGPSGRAVRSGTMQLCQDIASDPQYLPWHDEALKRGYASSIALPLLDWKHTVFGIMNVYAEEAQAFTAEEIKLLEEMASDLAFGVQTLHIRHERDLALVKNQEQLVQLQESLEDTMRAIARIVEMRDPYTAGHQVRVAELAAAIATQMGLPDEQVHAIHLASTAHDLGKIQIPAEILSKPGKITDLEFGLIKIHAQAGYDILKDIHFPWPIALMVLQHHERMNGSGYPQGLKGDQIILGARILSVADVVEAMSSHRPYRAGLGVEAALVEISAQRGGQFDPQVVDACLALFREQHYSFKS
jgi:PAS domain S-box-containing protein